MTPFTAALTNIRTTMLAKNPFVCVTIAFICGILFYTNSPITLPPNAFVGILSAYGIFCIALSQQIARAHITLLISWFVLAGYVNSVIHTHHYSTMPEGKYVQGTIVNSPEEKAKTYKCLFETIENRNACKTVIYIQKDSSAKQLCYGDVISVKNTFREIENSDKLPFDYKRFMNNQYIFSQAYVPTKNWKYIGHANSIFSFCMNIRKQCLHKLHDSGTSEKTLKLISALAFGDKSLLDEETKNNFQTAGAMHVLAVSGLHVGIINGILFFLLSFMRNRKILWLKILICILGIWAYACITGMSPSVQRASIMCSLISIALLLQRRTSTYNTLAVAAFFSLLLSPNDIFSVSFQLSYAAVLSIVYFGQYIQKLYTPSTPIGSYVWGIVAVSLSVQIGTIPLTLYYFGIIPTYGLLTNIIVIPLAFVILLCVILVLAFSAIPFVAEQIAHILNFVTDYLQDSIADITTFPHAQIDLNITQTQSVALYICIGLFILVLESWRQLQIQKNLTRL